MMTRRVISTWGVLMVCCGVLSAAGCSDDAPAAPTVNNVGISNNSTNNNTNSSTNNVNNSTSNNSAANNSPGNNPANNNPANNNPGGCAGDDAQCGQGERCEGDRCVPDCTVQADACGEGEACNPVTRSCQARCEEDAACAGGEICGAGGLCEAAECSTSTPDAACPGDLRCVAGRCLGGEVGLTQVVGGAERMASGSYRAVAIIGPAEAAVGAPASSAQHRLEAGTITILNEQ